MNNNIIYSIYTEFKPTNRILNWDETQAVMVYLDANQKSKKGGYTIAVFKCYDAYFAMRTQKSGEIKVAQYDSEPIISFGKLVKASKKIITASKKEAKHKGFVVPKYLGIFPITHTQPSEEELEQLLLRQDFRNYLKKTLVENHSVRSINAGLL